MPLKRFLVSGLAPRADCADGGPQVVQVLGGQAHHALRVLRLKIDDEVLLFDGLGTEARGVIVSVRQDAFEVEIRARHEAPHDVAARLLLAVAMPKGDRADWLVEKCAELDVGQLICLRCARSQVIPGEGKLDRWNRKAVEAAKQARSARTMTVGPVCGITEAIGGRGAAIPVWYADPQRGDTSLATVLLDHAREEGGMVLIGPEGGFTSEECEQIEDLGGCAVRLGRAILRIETGAVAAAALWSIFR